MPDTASVIDRSHFSTQALDPKHKYDAWEDSISAIFEVNPTENTLAQSFEADVESYMIGPLMFARCRTNGQAFARDKKTVARHNMDHILIQFYMEGDNTLLTPNGIVRTSPGDIQIIDMAQELNSIANPNAARSGAGRGVFDNMSLVIARDRLETFMPALHTLHLHVLKANTPLNLILRNYIMTMYQNASSLAPEDAGALVDPTLELLAVTVGKAPDTVDKVGSVLDQAALMTVKQFIDKNIHLTTLDPDMIARHIGVSRASLFRICRPIGGVMALVRNRRLLVARRLLNSSPTARSVKSIAYSLGFSDQSSFARAYKQQFGFSPTETREFYLAEASGRPGLLNKTAAFGDRKYEFWIANLVT
ncbi:helix-turn-helix domain-containing protein [Kordiimonas marina]|uniref:helix-turn-helix domain-containing protein n=1 Tax=Kordiimonas marina TaxID=2872312 RepID=UPI001FF25741|nr:helix-turn-helix domain-containing protein [Kordiimonas marina]MCJ9430063.1 helix-turn-helix domain-containing protein [Kordiimonas marina]